MKKLNFYKERELNTDDLVFSYLLETMIPNNRTWDYYINWNKVFDLVENYRRELILLNPLCKSEKFDEDLTFILEENPSVIRALPRLLATREASMSVLDNVSLPSFEYKDYIFNKKIDSDISEEEITLIVEFFEKSGLKKLINQSGISNLYDYLVGLEVGLDSNARKNRGGKINEDIVEYLLTNIYSLKKGTDFSAQVTANKARDLWEIELPLDKTDRAADFIIYKNDKIFWIETNFYTSQGSKLKATAGEYKDLYKFCKENNINLIWITDGAGWKSTINSLKESFLATDYIFNLSMISDLILEEIFES